MRPTSLALALAPLVAGCPPAAPPLPPPPPVAAAPAEPPSFASGTWGVFRSARFELSVPLPEGKAWRIDDHAGPWLSAVHAASSSTLVVRSWTEDGRVTRRRCEERARLWRDLPDPARAEAVQERSLDAPAGFDTFVSVGVLAGKPDTPLAGFALAFGGRAHRCFAWAYTTTASGPAAAGVVGERLATMVERSLGKVVLESELAPRVREEPNPR
jgi:hypothetical protein